MSTVTLLALVWLLFLFVQPGHPMDEGEHAHLAWLIGGQGLVPLDDFFQHHQPLLWDLLTPWFALGLPVHGVTYWGRSIVVLAALVTLLALPAAVPSSRRHRSRAGAVVAATVLIAFTAAFPRLLVIRPETVGLAATVAALALWQRQRAAADVAAGLLFGLAVLASPRFLPLAALFPLLPPAPDRLFELDPARLSRVGVGSVLAALAYHLLTPHSFADSWFNLAFSVHLQTVGPGNAEQLPALATAAAASLALFAVALALARGTSRRRLLFGLAFTLALAVLAARAASGYWYVQNFVAVLIATALLLGAAVEELEHSARWRISVGLTVVASLVLGFTLYRQLQVGETVFTVTARRIELSRLIPAGGRVILFPEAHPIDRRDTSYYGMPLIDGPDRLCRAVESFDGRPLPPCDFVADALRDPPMATFPGLFLHYPDPTGGQAEVLARSQYLLRGDLLLHRSLAERPATP